MIVLTVLVLRLILRRAHRRAVCLLWMIAVLRLLVPFQIECDWSLQPAIDVERILPAEQSEEFFDSGPVSEPVPPEFLENAVTYPLQPLPEKKADLLPWLWLTGAVLLGIHGMVSYLRLKKRVRDAIILEEGVWVCPGLETAFVLGFFAPQIYLPVLTAEERELVLLHERQHIRRLDHWWKLAAFTATALHWFNPLVWVTYVLMCRDMELACDEETVRDMDNARRKDYSAVLLRCAVKRNGIAACPVAFGEISVKERIKMVLNYKKPGFWVTVIALTAAIAVGVFLLTSPKELTELDRCEAGLKQWQEMEAYRFEESQSESGDGALYGSARIAYWSCGGEHLKKFSYADDLGWWQHWKDGGAYLYQFGSLDAEWTDTGWQEADFQEWEVIPWVMRLDWEELTIRSWESDDDGKTVKMTVDHPRLGVGTMTFLFDGDGQLQTISRTHTGADATVYSSTIELRETDSAVIAMDMKEFGVPAE